jgi:membrane-associated protein
MTLHDFKEFFKPETIITTGGFPLVLGIIFAETGLFIGFFLPGDSLLFVAGLFNGLGKFEINTALLIVSVIAAAVIGNLVGYYFGYKLGPGLFAKEDSLIFKKKYLEMTQSFYERHGGTALILGRFIPIIRTFVPILAGAIKLDFKKFFLYNIIGASLWVPIMIIAGFFLGKIEWVKSNVDLIVIGLIIVTMIPVFRTYFRERRRHRNMAAAEVENTEK